MTRVLLFQLREREDVERQEQACILDHGGLRPEQLTTLNLATTPDPAQADLDRADVVLIGGAGVYSVTEDYPFTAALADIVSRLHEDGRPLMGICWGHQFIARALGGGVETDVARGEVGAHPIELTPAGRADPLFAGCPATFWTHMGHNDHVTQLPPGGIELARTDRSANQVLRMADRPVYGTQFHIELNAERLIERLAIYQDLYMPEDDAFANLKANQRRTPEADGLLRRFLELYGGVSS